MSEACKIVFQFDRGLIDFEKTEMTGYYQHLQVKSVPFDYKSGEYFLKDISTVNF